MDTLVISSCSRFTIRIKFESKGEGLWILNYMNGRSKKYRYRTQYYAIKRAKKILHKLKVENPLPKKVYHKKRVRIHPVIKKNKWVQIRYYDTNF